MLLYDFVNSRASLEKDAIEMIETHLGKCDECAQDIDRIRQLISTPMPEDISAGEALPRTKFWKSILRRPHVPVYSAILFLIVMTSAIFFLERNPSTSFIALITAEESARKTGYLTYSLSPSQITRGGAKDASEEVPEISKNGADYVILNMNVLTFEDEDVSYEAVIRPESGAPAWESAVEKIYLETGTLWLVLDTRTLPPGNYEAVLEEHTSDGYRSTIMRSAFRIIE